MPKDRNGAELHMGDRVTLPDGQSGKVVRLKRGEDAPILVMTDGGLERSSYPADVIKNHHPRKTIRVDGVLYKEIKTVKINGKLYDEI